MPGRRARRGHVYRRRTKNGGWSSWHAVIDTEPGEDGKRRQVTRSFPTRDQAYAWLASQHTAHESGMAVGEYLSGWLDRQAQLRESTRVSYRGHIESYLVPLLGDRPLTGLDVRDVQALHAGLSAAGVSTALARRVHATLSSALTTAVDEGLIGHNPAARMRLPRADRYQAGVWSAGQAARFLAHTRSDDLAALWRLGLVCGLRRGELLGLRWRDIDFAAGTLTVRSTRVAVGAQVVEGPPKTARSRRVLPVDRLTEHALYTRRKTQAALAAEQGRLPSGYVFTDAHGAPLSPGWVSRRFADLVAAAGLPTIRLHDLRHTSATLGLAAGESLKQVSQRLGHSSIVVTADTYLSPPDALARESVVRLARTLDQTPTAGRKGAA